MNRITESRFRQIIQEELLLREGERSLLDEEKQAVDLTHELAALYRTLQMSHRTDQVMEMEDAYKQAVWDSNPRSCLKAPFTPLSGLPKQLSI